MLAPTGLFGTRGMHATRYFHTHVHVVRCQLNLNSDFDIIASICNAE